MNQTDHLHPPLTPYELGLLQEALERIVEGLDTRDPDLKAYANRVDALSNKLAQ